MFGSGRRGLSDTEPKTATAAEAFPKSETVGLRRRRILVDARYQTWSGALIGGVALVLLLLLNASLIVQHPAATAVAGAVTRPMSGGADRASWVLLFLGSAAFLGGVVLVGLLESHRTAGAAYAIRRAVDALREGRSDVRVHLRRGDHLQELARAINQLAETIDGERLGRS
jgi:hypothetical protein